MPFDAIGTGNKELCPVCEEPFIKRRADQKYCSSRCRKQRYQVEDQKKNPKNSKHSPTVRRNNYQAFDKAMQLAALLYTSPPAHRLGIMKDIVDRARNGDGRLRSILTLPELLRTNWGDRHLFFRRSPGTYMTISQAANEYCKALWGASVSQVVRGKVSEPPTGEVL